MYLLKIGKAIHITKLQTVKLSLLSQHDFRLISNLNYYFANFGDVSNISTHNLIVQYDYLT